MPSSSLPRKAELERRSAKKWSPSPSSNPDRWSTNLGRRQQSAANLAARFISSLLYVHIVTLPCVQVICQCLWSPIVTDRTHGHCPMLQWGIFTHVNNRMHIQLKVIRALAIFISFFHSVGDKILKGRQDVRGSECFSFGLRGLVGNRRLLFP